MINKKLPKKIWELLWLPVAVALLFLAIGNAIEFYYRSFDTSNNVVYELPVITDKTVYNPCDKQVLTFVRETPRSVGAQAIDELVLVREDGSGENIIIIPTTIFLEAGKRQINSVFTLPCEINEGVYRWQGSVTYYTDKGFRRETTWYSSEFGVINNVHN